jgi:hypothetical protein
MALALSPMQEVKRIERLMTLSKLLAAFSANASMFRSESAPRLNAACACESLIRQAIP